jgi:hypothetical protein
MADLTKFSTDEERKHQYSLEDPCRDFCCDERPIVIKVNQLRYEASCEGGETAALIIRLCDTSLLTSTPTVEFVRLCRLADALARIGLIPHTDDPIEVENVRWLDLVIADILDRECLECMNDGTILLR